ncbi:MAG: FkbM family methyltransferase [Sulfuricella sp.]|nr:FkbM family methyltransferase [Gammaproteobacteria bacterium]
MKILRVCGHTFLADHLNRDSVVLDFGMNRGQFSKSMVELFDCSVIGAEAHPALHAALPTHSNIVARNVAISGNEGHLELSVFDRHCASVVFHQLEDQHSNTISVSTMSLGTFLKENNVEHVHLLKCDIEGAELAMFEAASDEELSRIDQISIEFHVFMDPVQLGPVRRIVERLQKLSFWGLDFSKNRMDVLFVNQRAIPLTGTQKNFLAVTKYWRALARIAGRLVGQQDLGDTGLNQVRR